MTAAPYADANTGYEPIDDTARKEFETQGFLLLRNVLSEDHRAALEEAMDRVYAEERDRGTHKPDGTLHLLGFLTRDKLFGELLDHGPTFRYIWGLAGWNMYTHHNHLDVTPPQGPETGKPIWGWHQDGYRQNSDPEVNGQPELPRPMFSLKIGYVISDLSQTDRGATLVIPGSHLWNSLARPDGEWDGKTRPEGALEITANPGDAFIFDRRLWHSRSQNVSEITRKMLFVGYTYRWIRPLDDMPYDEDGEWFQGLTPVQRQLAGASPSTANRWGINWNGYIDDEIPVRKELKTRGLLDRSIPYLR